MEEGVYASRVKVATCNMNQWAMDFEGNKSNILESIYIAKKLGCKYRLGSELEITGYSCEDHFLELDTVRHSWEVLADILALDATDGIMVDIGIPVIFKGILYNCRAICVNRKVVLIRPKLILADDGNYREPRWFTTWIRRRVEDFVLPDVITKVNGQFLTKFGDAVVRTKDAEIGHEMCEELWNPLSPNIFLGLDGVDIIMNSSGSHFEAQKLRRRLKLIIGASGKACCAYVYSNQIGCDGNRLYFDGSSMIAVDGEVLNIAKQYTVGHYEVITAVIDLERIKEKKVSFKSRCDVAKEVEAYTRVEVDFFLGGSNEKVTDPIPVKNIDALMLSVEEEIAVQPSCYLWDYLRKSGGSGFFLPLSGGADSASVATIVYNMCYQIFERIAVGDERVLEDVRRVIRLKDFTPKSAQEIMNHVLFTAYLPSNYSSSFTKDCAQNLADEIGAVHYNVSIAEINEAFLKSTRQCFENEPKFLSQGGGSNVVDLALQNIQARSRMVLSYMMAQLIPWERKKEGFLIVLGSANIDEGLRGYFTKYDNSSADINPIGGISKTDLKRFLAWEIEHRGIKSLKPILESPPTAELRPLSEEGTYLQKDEEDMGFTYEELRVFGNLRKPEKCGPLAAFKRLVDLWPSLTVEEIATKVKNFYRFYSMNRHKQTTLTPALHFEGYGIEDNRFDLRPFLYNNNWDYQYRKIDELIEPYKHARMKQVNGGKEKVQ